MCKACPWDLHLSKFPPAREGGGIWLHPQQRGHTPPPLLECPFETVCCPNWVQTAKAPKGAHTSPLGGAFASRDAPRCPPSKVPFGEPVLGT